MTVLYVAYNNIHSCQLDVFFRQDMQNALRTEASNVNKVQ